MAQLNLGRVKGDKGEKGNTPMLEATASVTNTMGEASVSVFKKETAEGAVFDFAFSNIKGEKGEPGEDGKCPLEFHFDENDGVLTIVEKQ